MLGRPAFFLLTWVGAVAMPLAVLAYRFATGWARLPELRPPPAAALPCSEP